jgi:hypothetical protein
LWIRTFNQFTIQGSRVIALDKSTAKLYLLNLDPLLPVVKPLYPVFDRPVINQQGMISSLALMLDQQEYSITNWAPMVVFDPLLFDLCGFETDYGPAVASCYDLMVHFWLADDESHLRRTANMKRFISKPKKKLKANQRLAPKQEGVVKRLFKRALKGRINNFGPQVILQKLLAHVVVDVSAQMGILGNTDNVSVAFDGSTFYMGASHYGAKNVTAADRPYDFPILIKVVQANRHDSTTTVYALADILRLYPDLIFSSFLVDGAMDNYPVYELLRHFRIISFISIDARTKAKFNYPHSDIASFDDQGRPVCKGGKPFACWGFCQPYRLKYLCWYTDKGQNPTEECGCIESNYGKTIYLKSDLDPRMFTPVPRNSQAFTDKFKPRTTVERTYKRIFEDYAIEEYGARSTMIRAALATFQQ